MTITSRIIEKPLSSIVRDTASDIEIANASGLAVDVSSMLETVTRGGLVSPPEDLEFSDFYAAGNPMGFLIVGWTTNIATRRKLKWRPRGLGGDWTYTGLTPTYQLTGAVATTMRNIPGKQFEFYPYGITEGGYEEWSSVMWYINISGDGKITVYKSE